jgi:hypothetical protein
MEDKSISFPISEDMSPELYAKVTTLEAMALDGIKHMEKSYYTGLPPLCQEMIVKHGEDLMQVLRPNYKTSPYGEQTIWLKGNLATMKVLDANNQFIDISKLGPGQYRFIIRANLMYFGPHKDDNQVCSIQLRISELQYTPREVDVKWPSFLSNPPAPPASPADVPPTVA